MSATKLTCDLDEMAYYKERNLTLLRENNMLREKLADQESDYTAGNEMNTQYREILEAKIAKLEEENAKLRKFRKDVVAVVIG